MRLLHWQRASAKIGKRRAFMGAETVARVLRQAAGFVTFPTIRASRSR
jgi:hypothetical protein